MLSTGPTATRRHGPASAEAHGPVVWAPLPAPATDSAACRTSRSMRSEAGHPTIVSRMPTSTRPSSPATTRSTMSSSVMGLRISGSMTLDSAARTAAARVVASASGIARLVVFVTTVELLEHGTQLGADELA